MTVTDRFVELARERLGERFEDLRGVLKGHPKLRFKAIDSRAMRYACLHHSATAVTSTWKGIETYHINADPARDKEPWPGIGYHVGVRRGTVALLGDLDTQRAHVKGRNHEALGICVTGNYDMRELDAQDLEALRAVIALLDETYGHAKELTWHGAMLPSYTSCPGSAIKALAAAGKLRLPPPPPAPPPSPPVPAFVVGPGVWSRMRELGDEPVSDELYLAAGTPAEHSLTAGRRFLYYWLRAAGEVIVIERAA